MSSTKQPAQGEEHRQVSETSGTAVMEALPTSTEIMEDETCIGSLLRLAELDCIPDELVPDVLYVLSNPPDVEEKLASLVGQKLYRLCLGSEKDVGIWLTGHLMRFPGDIQIIGLLEGTRHFLTQRSLFPDVSFSIPKKLAERLSYCLQLGDVMGIASLTRRTLVLMGPGIEEVALYALTGVPNDYLLYQTAIHSALDLLAYWYNAGKREGTKDQIAFRAWQKVPDLAWQLENLKSKLLPTVVACAKGLPVETIPLSYKPEKQFQLLGRIVSTLALLQVKELHEVERHVRSFLPRSGSATKVDSQELHYVLGVYQAMGLPRGYDPQRREFGASLKKQRLLSPFQGADGAFPGLIGILDPQIEIDCSGAEAPSLQNLRVESLMAIATLGLRPNIMVPRLVQSFGRKGPLFELSTRVLSKALRYYVEAGLAENSLAGQTECT